MRGARRAGLVSCVGAAAICLLAGQTPAHGLTDEEIFRQYQFHFVPAGARALGMGGAYVSLAEDASAAAINPAGLRFAKKPHLFVELGRVDNDVRRSSSHQGSLDVNLVTGDRDLPFLSLNSATEPDAAFVPGFIGFAWPFSFGRGRFPLVVAGSRQVVHSQDVSIPSGRGGTGARFSFDTFPNTVSGNKVVAYSIGAPVTGSVQSDIVYWNASASLDLHPDFSVGATISYATLDLEASTRTEIDDPLQILVDTSHPRLPAQPTTDVYETAADGSDTDIAWAIGVLWHPDTVFAGRRSPLTFGATFRRGAAFGVEESSTLNGKPDRRFENTIAVPDRFAVGVTYGFLESWLAGIEVERVDYSDMMEGFQEGVSYLTSEHLADGAFTTGSKKSISYKLNDGYVYHVGVERELRLRGSAGPRLALRAGWFLTPDREIRMTRFNSTDPAVRRTYLKAFPGGDSESHVTAGVGLDWDPHSVQVGFEYADAGTRLLVTYTQDFGSGR